MLSVAFGNWYDPIIFAMVSSRSALQVTGWSMEGKDKILGVLVIYWHWLNESAFEARTFYPYVV